MKNKKQKQLETMCDSVAAAEQMSFEEQEKTSYESSSIDPRALSISTCTKYIA